MSTWTSSRLRVLRTAALTLMTIANFAHAEPEPSAPSSDPAADCVTGFEQSQVLRQSGKLRAARVELLKCAQLQCHKQLQVSCTRWLEEVENATPTIIVEATLNGEDRSDVRVEMDGELLTEELVGKALPVDPGPHEFRFSHADLAPIQKKFVMREGEKRRLISIAFGKESEATKPKLPPEQPLAPVPQMQLQRPVPVITYVLAGVSLAGLATFAVLGVTASDRERQLKESCSPTCSDSEVESLKSRYTVANVVLGVGAAAGVAALITYFVRPSVMTESSAISATLNVSPEQAVGSARIRF